MGKRSFIDAVLVSFPLVCAAGGVGAKAAPESGTWLKKRLTTIRALLNTLESQLDLAKTKLTVDRLYESPINIASAEQQLGALAVTVRKRCR